jgi:DNA-binding CsgD family transcriptional regulator
MTGKRVRSPVVHRGTILEMTPRERRVLVYVVAGMDHDTISQALRIHRSTTITYIDRFNRMAGAHNRNQLAAWAIVTGLVAPAEICELWLRHGLHELVAWLDYAEVEVVG